MRRNPNKKKQVLPVKVDYSDWMDENVAAVVKDNIWNSRGFVFGWIERKKGKKKSTFGFAHSFRTLNEPESYGLFKFIEHMCAMESEQYLPEYEEEEDNLPPGAESD